ncbi:MAG: DegT/DnrJ/EryC1/StrS family aminotransferase [Saprospiraceae bacterium]|nr:DegT/DnrJ/EryC1/StrS family aminotransferase [Saprospiraceae bacterium]
MKIPFSPPYIDTAIEAEVLDSLRSGWITTGPKVKALEAETARLAGVQQVLCCNSATSALMLALHWYGVGRGDEVIVPAYTYCATALAVMHIGARPVMVDVGSDFNIAVDRIRAAITPNTKAIIPVDIAGWPCDYHEIMALVQSPEVQGLFQPRGAAQEMLGRVLVLSDAAHSIGATYRGSPAALWADLTVYSFHAVKNVTTAEGGAIAIHLPAAFDHEEVYRTLRLWSLNGQTKDAFTKSQAGGWRYDIVYPGFKMNMPDLLAAVGLAQIRQYGDHLLPARRHIFGQYHAFFGSAGRYQLPPHQSEDKSSSCHLYPLRLLGAAESQRDEVIARLGEAGVASNVHFVPLPMLTVFKERGYRIADFPVAYDNYAREISLPIYPQLTEAQVTYICEQVRSCVNSVL